MVTGISRVVLETNIFGEKRKATGSSGRFCTIRSTGSKTIGSTISAQVNPDQTVAARWKIYFRSIRCVLKVIHTLKTSLI